MSRLGRAVGCAIVLSGVTLPPLVAFAALAVVVVRGDIAQAVTVIGTDGVVTGGGSGAVNPAALDRLRDGGRDWFIVGAAGLAFVWWTICAATAARIVARITALRS